MKHGIDAFYDFLDRIGYMHPIHPAMVHMPIAFVVGAVAFLSISAFPRFRHLRPSGYHILVLALVFWFPTVLFGIMDWQRYLGGAWLFAIKIKMALALVLLALLVIGVVLGFRDETTLNVLGPIYALSFVVVVVLGYYGGQLVYGGLAPAGPAIYKAGEKIFDNNCTGCHAHGGNVIAPNLPLDLAPQLKAFQTFKQFIRKPHMPNGSAGAMPDFSHMKISDKAAKALYEYIVHVIAKPIRNGGSAPSQKDKGAGNE